MMITTDLSSSFLKKVAEKLVSGTDLEAFGALALVSIVTLVPLAMLRNAYCFTVGYGAAIAGMSLQLIVAFDFDDGTPWLAILSLVYGLRLAGFLLYREKSVTRMKSQTKAFDDKLSHIRIIPMAILLAILYACMTSPMLFMLRSSTRSKYELMANVLCVLGILTETVADQHKLLVKRRKCVAYGEKRFVSPTRGLYGICRHPNYLGEIMFWTGILLGGLSMESKVGLACGLLGWICIVLIMMHSAKRLDAKQLKVYGQQKDYIKWRDQVRGSLLPMP